jgi:hypothetical protein
MSGFFSKLGKKADELAAAAAEKASELKEAASEKIEEVVKDKRYKITFECSGNIREFEGTKEELFEQLKQEELLVEMKDQDAKEN